MKFKLEHVHYMPKVLEPGVLYVSEEFKTAAHLCACGCGAKIRTPLGPTEWRVYESKKGPCLFPSVGNWQQTCQSHYLIQDGKTLWAGKWSPEEIAVGRKNEALRRVAHYETLDNRRKRLWPNIRQWIRNFFSL